MGLLNKDAKKRLQPICDVDLEKYSGTWFEIARYSHAFEKGMEQVTATYKKKRNGKIRVINSGVKNGIFKKAKATAWVPDPECTGRLLVRFFFPFKSEYNIVILDREYYQYAVVTGKNKKYLWILSRTPQMEPSLYEKLVEEAVGMGFRKRKIERVHQSEER
jgi:lipocalin